MKDKILKAIKELKEKSKKRNFSQTFDLIISLKEIDMKKPESKITDEFPLPKGYGEEAKIVVISDNVRPEGAEVLSSADMDKISKNKREAKKFVGGTDFFLAEPKLMPVVAKSLGQLMGPRGKLPKIMAGDAKSVISNLKKSVKIRLKDVPVMQFKVGREDMPDEDVAENIEALIKFLEHRLPKGKVNIGKIILKTTMGEPIKVDVYGEGRKA